MAVNLGTDCLDCGADNAGPGWGLWCGACRLKHRYRWSRPNKGTCFRCGNAPSKSYSPYCTSCEVERKQAWNDKQARLQRIVQGPRGSVFRYTKAEYVEWHAERDGRCDICGVSKPRLDVDHCHSTGRFRGLLCRRCNLQLGHWRDEIPILEAAIAYLRKSRE